MHTSTFTDNVHRLYGTLLIVQSAENHRMFPSFFRKQQSTPLESRSTPSRLFSLRLMFDRSKLESLRDVSVTTIGDTLSLGFPKTDLLIKCFIFTAHRGCPKKRPSFNPIRGTFQSFAWAGGGGAQRCQKSRLPSPD